MKNESEQVFFKKYSHFVDLKKLNENCFSEIEIYLFSLGIGRGFWTCVGWHVR